MTWNPTDQEIITVAKALQSGTRWEEAISKVGWSAAEVTEKTFGVNAKRVLARQTAERALTAESRAALEGAVKMVGRGALRVALVKGALITVGVALLAWIGYEGYQAWSARNDASTAEKTAQETQRKAEEQRKGAATSSTTGLAQEGWVVVEVTNIGDGVLTVVSKQASEASDFTCHFLHGGLCSDEGGKDVAVQLHAISPTFATGNEAWAWLCKQVDNVRINKLAEGTLGEYGGKTVAIGTRGGGDACL